MDTRGHGELFFRVTDDPSTLQRADDIIHQAFPNERSFVSRSVTVATWDRVGYFSSQIDRVRRKLCLLAINRISDRGRDAPQVSPVSPDSERRVDL